MGRRCRWEAAAKCGMPFVEEFDLLEIVFAEMGRDSGDTKKGSGLLVSEQAHLRTKGERVVSHVFGNAFRGSVILAGEWKEC